MSIVSLSRLAGPPQVGHSTLTQSSAAASGETPARRQVGAAQLGQHDGQLVLGHRHLAVASGSG